MTALEDDGRCPPCRLCDEPTAVDTDGFEYEYCQDHLLEMSDPFTRNEQDPDRAYDAMRDNRDRWAS